VKCASLPQEIDFPAPNSCSLPWLVKGATQLCTFKKECNKVDITAAQYFWLVDHNDWSRWFAISSSHIYAVTVLLVGLPEKTAKLRHVTLLSKVTYWAPPPVLLDNVRQSIRNTRLGNTLRIEELFGNSLRTWLEQSKTTLGSSVCMCVFNHMHASSWLWSLHDDGGQSLEASILGNLPGF
jgi:hypothetical protein